MNPGEITIRTKRVPLSLLSVAALLFLFSPQLTAQAKWEVSHTWHVGGEGGWDYVTVDPQAHRFFVTRGTHTMVFDSATGKVLGDIPGQIRSHGVALVPSLNRGFITDGGGSGAILVFDLKTYAVLGKIAAMPDADGIIYDATMHRVLAVSGDGGALMTIDPAIDPKNGKMEPPIDLGGKPEFLAAGDSGKVYVNLENKDLIAEVDLHTRKVLARWPVTPGGHPVGMALDKATHRLFIGCRNPQKMIVMSAVNGKILASVPIGAGVDATAVNDGQAFASCRDGSLVVVNARSAASQVEQVVKTSPGARTMGLDPTTHTIYLPTAEFEPPTPGAPSARPKQKAGSFMIVVVTRH